MHSAATKKKPAAKPAAKTKAKAKKVKKPPPPLPQPGEDFVKAHLDRSKIKFTPASRTAARDHWNLEHPNKKDQVTAKTNLGERDLAMPHRVSFAYLRERTLNYLNQAEGDDVLHRWTDRLMSAGAERIAAGDPHHALIRRQDKAIEGRRKDLVKAVGKPNMAHRQLAALRFLRAVNTYHPNVPDLAPHSRVNARVQEHWHLNVIGGKGDQSAKKPATPVKTGGSSKAKQPVPAKKPVPHLTPSSQKAFEMTPHKNYKIPRTPGGSLFGRDGRVPDFDASPLVARHGEKVFAKDNKKKSAGSGDESD